MGVRICRAMIKNRMTVTHWATPTSDPPIINLMYIDAGAMRKPTKKPPRTALRPKPWRYSLGWA